MLWTRQIRRLPKTQDMTDVNIQEPLLNHRIAVSHGKERSMRYPMDFHFMNSLPATLSLSPCEARSRQSFEDLQAHPIPSFGIGDDVRLALDAAKYKRNAVNSPIIFKQDSSG
jgi:hypothetical protein